MSLSSVILRGFGNGVATGSLGGVILRGYTQSETVIVQPSGFTLGVTSAIKITVGASSEIDLTVGKKSEIDLSIGVN